MNFFKRLFDLVFGLEHRFGRFRDSPAGRCSFVGPFVEGLKCRAKIRDRTRAHRGFDQRIGRFGLVCLQICQCRFVFDDFQKGREFGEESRSEYVARIADFGTLRLHADRSAKTPSTWTFDQEFYFLCCGNFDVRDLRRSKRRHRRIFQLVADRKYSLFAIRDSWTGENHEIDWPDA